MSVCKYLHGPPPRAAGNGAQARTAQCSIIIITNLLEFVAIRISNMLNGHQMAVNSLLRHQSGISSLMAAISSLTGATRLRAPGWPAAPYLQRHACG